MTMEELQTLKKAAKIIDDMDNELRMWLVLFTKAGPLTTRDCLVNVIDGLEQAGKEGYIEQEYNS